MLRRLGAYTEQAAVCARGCEASGADLSWTQALRPSRTGASRVPRLALTDWWWPARGYCRRSGVARLMSGLLTSLVTETSLR